MSVDAQSVTMSQQTSQVLSKAALRAAAILGLTHKELAEIVGVSPAFISKIKAGAATLAIGSKQAELAAIFVRVFRALDAIVGGDEETAREFSPYAGTCWRFVEDQNTSSSMRLVDTLDEQTILEDLLDATKPPVPAACQHLHYLQFTPFRYAARHATRFRQQGERAGVYYASEEIETAATEVAFYRLLFYLESPRTQRPATPFEMTAFAVDIQTETSVDISAVFEPDTSLQFADPVDYTACHRLSAEVRANDGQVIRFPSVRAPGGTNLAVLDCAAFCDSVPRDFQGWWFRFTDTGLFAKRRFGEGSLEFQFSDFADDPRIAVLLAQQG